MKIACVNYEPVTSYKNQGWSCDRLGRYYNPANCAKEVCVFAYRDQDWQVSPSVRVVGYHSFGELEKRCKTFGPDVIRCYEAFHPFCDYTLILALSMRIPSYLSLHDMRVRHYPKLAKFTVITAYTETLAKRAGRELRRDVQVQLNGIDSQLFCPKRSSSIDQRVMSAEYRVFTVGRDDPVKNIATTIEATRILSGRVNSLAHVLVGPGTEKIAFDGVHLGLGSVTEEMIAAYSNWCNCFLQVQLVSDLGMAASEALMVGRPVVVTGDPSGNAQYLIDEDRGVIVPIEKVKDAQFVTEALDMCLHRQYDYDAIRKWAIERYDAEKLKKEEANRYRKLIGTTSEKTREEHLETIRRRIVLLSMWMELTSSEVKRLIPALIAFPSRIARAAGRRLRRTWWRVA